MYDALLAELDRQGELLHSLERQTALHAVLLVELERGRLASGAVPLAALLSAWLDTEGGTFRDRAKQTSRALAAQGFGHLPGAKPAAIERRMRRINRRGSGQP